MKCAGGQAHIKNPNGMGMVKITIAKPENEKKLFFRL